MKTQISVWLCCLLGLSMTAAYGQEDEAAQQLQRLEQIQRLQQQQTGSPSTAQQALREAVRATGNQPATPATSESARSRQVRATTGAPPPPPIVSAAPAIPQHRVSGMQKQTINELAFDHVLQQQFPLSPEQIVKLRKRFQQQQRAIVTEPHTPPLPAATSQIVQLAPGSTPPVIRLAKGFVSSLVFLDSTGAPWPIASYDLGNPQAFNIQWDKTSNTLMVQATKLYTYGNIAIQLVGLNTPVMMTLVPGQKAVDYRVDLRIQGLGPNASNIPMGEALPNGANPELLSVLDGVPPTGALPHKVIGGSAQVWVRAGKIFVRTRLAILSPSWLATMSSADGMHVYEMQMTPLLLVSDHGRVRQLKIQGL